MAFVNEYISDEDVEAYKIRDIWKNYTYNWNKGREKLMGGFTWTVDKERNFFFIPISTGRYEESNQTTCVLSLEGALFLVTIVTYESEFDYANKKGRVKWGLKEIRRPDGGMVVDNEIIPVLKDALSAYGDEGVHSCATDYPVTFAF